MAHMSRHAGVHFDFVQSIGLIPRHIPGLDNCSDMMTKVLGEQRLKFLLRKFFGLELPGICTKVAVARWNGCQLALVRGEPSGRPPYRLFGPDSL